MFRNVQNCFVPSCSLKKSCNFIPVYIKFMAVNDRVFCAAVKLVLISVKINLFFSFFALKNKHLADNIKCICAVAITSSFPFT